MRKVTIRDLDFKDKKVIVRLDFNVPLITNLQLAQRFVKAISETSVYDLQIKSWDEYQ